MRRRSSAYARYALALVAAAVMSLATAQSSSGDVEGRDVYAETCSSCHQEGGQGISGVFPPLANHVPDLVRLEGGRQYVLGVVLFGLQGEIEVNDTTYDGTMPSWQQRSDEDIASVLNHVVFDLSGESTEEGDLEPFSASEVEAAREDVRTPQEMHSQRPSEPEGENEDSAGVATMRPVLTQAQVERASRLYGNRCTECHGEDLGGGVVGGPPLSGSYFAQRWAGRSVAELFEYTRARMPQDRPGSLSDQDYANLVALILRNNGVSPTGTELPANADALRAYVIPE